MNNLLFTVGLFELLRAMTGKPWIIESSPQHIAQ
jgi:hypothetical protein